VNDKNYPTPQQREIVWKALTGLASLVLVLLGLGVLSLVLYGIVFFQTVLIPLAIASLLAFVLDPVVEWLIRRGVSRTRAVVYVFSLFLVAILGFFAFIIPMLYAEIVRMTDAFPALLQWISQKWQSLYSRYHDSRWWIGGDQLMIWLQGKGPAFAHEAVLWIWKGAERLFSAFSLIIGLVAIPLYVFYLLIEKPRLKKNWREYIPLRKSQLRDEMVEIVNEVRLYLAAFFRGQLVNALTLGLLATIGLSLAGVNYAVLLGMLTGLLSFIPYLGVVLSGITALIVAYFQAGCWWWDFRSGNWGYILLVLCIYGLVHFCEGWFITPRIQGKFVGLHPMTIIVSLLAWSLLLGGMLGAILAVPLTAILKVLMFRYVWGGDISQKYNQEKP
jgi:predicted PurR-regulated permease PerM